MSEPLETTLRSATAEVVLGQGRRFCLIGERINPTGRKIFQEQLRQGDPAQAAAYIPEPFSSRSSADHERALL